MKGLGSSLLVVALVAAACTSSASTDLASTTTVATDTTVAGSPPEAPTTFAEAGPAELLVGRGVDVESEVISLGLVGTPSADFRAGYSAYWEARNAGGGVAGFSVEVVAVASLGDAVGLDLAAASVVGTDRAGGGDLALVGDLIRSSVDDVVSVASDFADLLEGAQAAEYDMVVDASSPAACRASAVGRTVVEADRAALGNGSIVVICTSQTTATELLESGGDWAAVVIVAWSWDPAAVDIAGDRPLVVVGSTPGPGVDDAPAGELLSAVLGEGPWTHDSVDGYTAARSLHAVLEAAFRQGDVRRTSIASVADRPDGFDLGFGPGGVSLGRVDPDSPTGVLVFEWRSPR